MMTSLPASTRKPLKIITQQQNNSNSQNKHSYVATPNHKDKQLQMGRKISFKTIASEQKLKVKGIEEQNDRQRTDHKNIRYYEPFERNAEGLEKQQQSCQNYFLRKTIMTLYKLFERTQSKWNLYALNYPQLLKIMQELGYLKTEIDEKVNSKVSQDLKRCYWLWINISQGKPFSLVNLIITLFCIEHLEYDQQLVQDIVGELTKGINKFQLDNNQEQPKFIFFVKNQKFVMRDGVIKLQKQDIQKIQTNLKDFRLNKLMKASNHNDSDKERQEELRYFTISKKSEQLAENKRQKILKDIRQRQPHVREIQLHHILSYKTEKCKKKQVTTNEILHKRNKVKGGKKIVVDSHSYLLEEAHQKIKEIPVVIPIKKSKKIQNNLTNLHQKWVKQITDPYHEQQSEIKMHSKIESRQSQQSLDFFNSQELFQSIDPNKHKIVDELQWEQIPKQPEQIIMQHELLQVKDDLFEPQTPLSHTFSKTLQRQNGDKQRKRKEYLDLPILFVDVNIQQGKKQRIVIYEGDQASDLAKQFGKKHGLSQEMIGRLQSLLQLQIGSILTKIDQANEEDCSELY